MRRAIAAVIAVLFLAACAAPFTAQTCAEQSKEALTAIQAAAREWDDANKVQDITVPDCAAAAKQALVDSMDASINGYVDFLGQKPDSTVQASFKTANEKMDQFGQEVVKLGAP